MFGCFCCCYVFLLRICECGGWWSLGTCCVLILPGVAADRHVGSISGKWWWWIMSVNRKTALKHRCISVQYTAYQVCLFSSHSLLILSHWSTNTSSLLRPHCVTTWHLLKPEDTTSLTNTGSVILWMCAGVFRTASRNDVHLEGCVPLRESDRNQRTTCKKNKNKK